MSEPQTVWIVGESDDHIEGVYEAEEDAQRVFAFRNWDAMHDSGHSSWWIDTCDYFRREAVQATKGTEAECKPTK